MRTRRLLLGLALTGLAAGCVDNDRDARTIADELGIGAECAVDTDCFQGSESEPLPQSCLAFKGGYCGVEDCTADVDCPSGSACVRHTDGSNYCFRVCTDKTECNANRSLDNEANCSSNVDLVDGGNLKTCVPPTG
jgi:hypothetical protein